MFSIHPLNLTFVNILSTTHTTYGLLGPSISSRLVGPLFYSKILSRARARLRVRVRVKVTPRSQPSVTIWDGRQQGRFRSVSARPSRGETGRRYAPEEAKYGLLNS